MESATVATPREATEAATGSRTIADLFPLAVRKHGSHRAVTYRDEASGEWVSKTYEEVGEIVRALSLGLIDLGIENGDKVAILSNTRPEWSYFDFAALSAGATVVPIYQTNSPEECQYVLKNSDSTAVIVEDDAQLEKIRQVRGALRVAQRRRLGGALELGHAGRHLHLHLHVRDHGPSEGVRDLTRQLPLDARHGALGQRARRGRGHVSIPAARPFLRPADPVRDLRPRRDARLLGARPDEDHGQPGGGQADLLPLRAADLREDLHGRHRKRRQGGWGQEARLLVGDRG